MIMHPDPTRILQQDVPPGANLLFDRAIEGVRGERRNRQQPGHTRCWLHLQTPAQGRLDTGRELPGSGGLCPLVRPASTSLGMLLGAADLHGARLVDHAAVDRTADPLHRPGRRSGRRGRSAAQPLAGRTRDEIGTHGGRLQPADGRNQEQKRIVRDRLAFLQTLIDTIPNPVYYKDLEGAISGLQRRLRTGFRQGSGRDPRPNGPPARRTGKLARASDRPMSNPPEQGVSVIRKQPEIRGRLPPRRALLQGGVQRRRAPGRPGRHHRRYQRTKGD